MIDSPVTGCRLGLLLASSVVGPAFWTWTAPLARAQARSGGRCAQSAVARAQDAKHCALLPLSALRAAHDDPSPCFAPLMPRMCALNQAKLQARSLVSLMLSCTGPLVLPDYRIFAHALAIQVPCTVLLHVVGVFIYLVRRHRRLSFLLCPSAAALAALPFWLLPFAEARLGSDAQFGVFVGATAFSFAAFRTAEAALGTTPPAATVSLAAWLLYFTSSLDPVYADGLKPVAAPAGALRNRLARLPARMLALGALCSLLLPHGARSPLNSELARLGASPLVCLWVSNVVYSVALWLFLALCFDIGAAPLLAQGVAAGEAFLNPVFASHSPKEFWGKRWNLQVNALLRRVCFKPFAKLAGSAAAAIATFGVSALFHEYQFALTFQSGGYRPGRVSAFFGAMAGLCLAQSVCERVPQLRSAARALPSPVQISLNICTLAPFGHWFVWIWVDHGFMATIARMVPTLSCTSS